MAEEREDKWGGLPAPDSGGRTPAGWLLAGNLGLLGLSSLGARASGVIAFVGGAFLAGKAAALAALVLMPLELLLPAASRLLRKYRSKAKAAPEFPPQPAKDYHSQVVLAGPGIPSGAGAAGEAQAPEPAVPGGPVESGAFRVDLSRAVDKLARYQLADPINTGATRSKPTTLTEHLEWAQGFSLYQQGSVPSELKAKATGSPPPAGP